MKIILSVLSFSVLLAGVFAVSDAFAEPVLDAKWHATAFAVCVLLFVLSLGLLCVKGNTGIAAMADIVKWQVVAVCSAQAVFGMLQIFGAIYGHGNETMGSFDNPAGFASCLAFSLPVGMDLMWRSGKKAKWLLILAKAVCVMAIVASGSRTGLICILLFALFLVRPKISSKVLGFCMLLVVLFVLFAVFGMKTDSTMGRWFIIQRTAEMIAERPLAGWGIGGFYAHYMNFQADYFAGHADSPYAMLADNVRHPLNEFLLVCVHFGLAGLLVVLSGLVLTSRYYHRHPSDAGRQGMCILLMILVFAMLSYPFQYPFTWLMLIYSMFAIYNSAIYNNVFRVSRRLCYIVLPVSVAGTVGVWGSMLRNIELCEIQEKCYYGMSERMMPRFEKLYPEMRHDYRFLFSYATEQYMAGRLGDALKTANECSALLADYDLCLMKGDIFRELRQYDSALHYYRRAHQMCPSRFVPLYEMFNTYGMCGNKYQKKRMADKIWRLVK